MSEPSMTILFVENPAASAEFYARLLGREPVESSPTFAMFSLANGTMLGLWSRHTAEPKPAVTGGGTEIGFTADDRIDVDRIHAEWKGRGLPILQEPVAMDFGYTFVALDPDAHRLRVFTPEAA